MTPPRFCSGKKVFAHTFVVFIFDDRARAITAVLLKRLGYLPCSFFICRSNNMHHLLLFVRSYIQRDKKIWLSNIIELLIVIYKGAKMGRPSLPSALELHYNIYQCNLSSIYNYFIKYFFTNNSYRSYIIHDK